MSDILERLQNMFFRFGTESPNDAANRRIQTAKDAADEIEKLRAALREIRNKARTGRPPFMSSKTDFFQIASKALGEKE
jgi:hypothetical protein